MATSPESSPDVGTVGDLEIPPQTTTKSELPDLTDVDLGQLLACILSSDSMKSIIVPTELKRTTSGKKRSMNADAEADERAPEKLSFEIECLTAKRAHSIGRHLSIIRVVSRKTST